MTRVVVALVTAAFALLLVTTVVFAQFDSLTLDDCDVLIRDEPQIEEGYRCLGTVGQRTGSMDEAIHRLEAWTALAPHRKLARYQIGFILSLKWDAAAAGPLRESVEAFALDGDTALEIRARARLAFTLTNSGAFDEAEESLERAAALIPEIDDPRLEAELRLQQGWTALRRGDYGRSLSSFRMAEQTVFPEGPGKEQSDTLSALGAIHWVTGRFEIASAYYRQQVTHDRERGDLASLSLSMGNLLGATKEAIDAGQLDVGVAVSIADEILAEPSARAAPLALCQAHSLRGELATDIDTARHHFDVAMEVARESGIARLVRGTLMTAGARLVTLDPQHPEEGFEMLAEAIDMSLALRGTGDYVRTLEHVQRARMAAGPREAAIAQSMTLLEDIERLRDLQSDEDVRAGAFAQWARVFRRTAGYILRSDEGAASDDDLALAFHTLERMRARILLDRLDAAGAVPAPPTGLAAEKRERLIEEIVATQRELRQPALEGADRDALIAELDRLELAEATSRAAMAELDPRYKAVRNPDYATLDAVRRSLADDEALVSFQLARDVSGGSWALVVDRHKARAVSLPSAGTIRGELEILEGLIARRDVTEAAMATRMGKALMQPVLRELPHGVTKLVLIPDGILWSLPFDVLRMVEGGMPLAWTHRLSLAPSATLWLRWRGQGPNRAIAPVLSLADPDLGWAVEQTAEERAWALERGLALGRLPRARAEGDALVRKLGGESRLLMDDEASESFLKNGLLGQYALLHVAAHALVDQAKPHRSAILLSPGSDDEDGLLQLREIAELSIDGGVVLLTGCRTASGVTLAGEGPLSLARSFFLAGATGVIGGLWPLRDDDTAEMMVRFAERLGGGSSVSDALSDAKRSMIEAGSPAAAWSGLVLIGDGGLVPVPGDAVTAPANRRIVLLIALLLGVTTLLVYRKARRGR